MRRDEASEHLLARIHFAGALRRRDLALDRTSRRALRDLVEGGAVVERVGVVFAPGTDWPLIACRMLGGLLTCHSALAYYSLPELPHPGTVHVAIPSSRGRVRPLAGVVVHREPARWPPGMSPPVAPPRLLVARMLRCAEETPAVVVADAALRRGLVSRAELAAMLRSNRSGGPPSGEVPGESALAHRVDCSARARGCRALGGGGCRCAGRGRSRHAGR